MTELITELYYMVDDWANQYNPENREIDELMAQKEALQRDIVLRLGEGGREMMEALAELNLKLEDIHDLALFRAAMGLGVQIARPLSLPPTGGKVPQCAHWGG